MSKFRTRLTLSDGVRIEDAQAFIGKPVYVEHKGPMIGHVTRCTRVLDNTLEVEIILDTTIPSKQFLSYCVLVTSNESTPDHMSVVEFTKNQEGKLEKV